MLTVRVILLTLVAGPLAGFAQSPGLTHVSPGALLPGKTQEITLHGANLAGATNLWTSFPAKVLSAAATNASAAKFQLAVPDDAPVGIHAVRVASTAGVSSPVLLMVDDLPGVADRGTNTRAASAQPLAWPAAVDGTGVALGFKFYRVTVKAGDRLAIEAVAQRLGSKLDPVLRLLDFRGRELAFGDDESGLGGDCRLAHVFAAGGDYFIELRDIAYGGGGDYRFRLRVGDFPLANLPFPAAVKAGTTGTFAFVGPQVDQLKPVTAAAPADASSLPLAVKFPGGKASAFVTALVSTTTEVTEAAEPNDGKEAATPFTLPAGLNGRFRKPKDRDFWKFEARKGQRVLFTAQTRSIASASEVMLQLRDQTGNGIASSAPNDAGEGSVTNTIPADGTYFLVVDELIRRGGPQHAYRVVAELLPGFTLDTEVEKIVAAPGGSFSVKVNVTRRDYSGPVTLALTGLDGVQLADQVIKDKGTNGTLKVTLPGSAVPGSLTHFRIVGRALVGGAEAQAEARTTPALRKLFPGLAVPPRGLDGTIALGVKAAGP